MSEIVTAPFDYATLDAETRIVVQQRTGEIKERLRKVAEEIRAVGERLIEVRERIPGRQFTAWLAAEFEWSQTQAYRYISVAEQFRGADSSQIGKLSASALYALAAPSVPEEARQEALERAEQGERITHSTAQQIVAQHRPPPAPPPSDPLALVRAALERGDTKAAYAAARAAAGDDWGRAMAAVDARVEGRRLEEALALLEGAPPLSPFDRHVLERHGWQVTGATQYAQGEWCYEVIPPKTAGRAAPAPLWKSKAGITAIIRAEDDAPPDEPPATVEPAIDAEAWRLLSERASVIGARMLGYGTETVLIEPDGTKSRYPVGGELSLADRVAHLERAAEGLPAPAPPADAVVADDMDDPAEGSDAFDLALAQIRAAVAVILDQLLSEAELRLFARLFGGVEHYERAWRAPLSDVRAGLMDVVEEFADGALDDADALPYLRELGVTAFDEPDEAPADVSVAESLAGIGVAPAEPEDAPAPTGLAKLIAEIAALEGAAASYTPARVRGEAELLDRELQDYAEVLSDAQYEDLAARVSKLRRYGQEQRKGAA